VDAGAATDGSDSSDGATTDAEPEDASFVCGFDGDPCDDDRDCCPSHLCAPWGCALEI
jgi:hypothetical protein